MKICVPGFALRNRLPRTGIGPKITKLCEMITRFPVFNVNLVNMRSILTGDEPGLFFASSNGTVTTIPPDLTPPSPWIVHYAQVSIAG